MVKKSTLRSKHVIYVNILFRLDSVKFQIPYNNKVEQIKEKCNSI